MTPAEVADVLTKCSAFDQRSIGEGDVLAWHEVIGRMDVGDCLNAVTKYYSENGASAGRVMAADIKRLAAGFRDQRRSRENQAARAIGAGPTVRDRSAEVTALVRQVADRLPQPDLHERAVEKARAERGRPAPLPARPKRKPPKDYPNPQTSQAADLARQYLADGHDPDAVAERLAVSRRWCRRAARDINPDRSSR